MALKTLSDLKDDALARADLYQVGGVVSDLELTNYINEGLGELYDLLILADDARTFTKNATVPVKVGQFSFRLPFDFYRAVSVHVRRGNHYDLADKADPSEYAELADNRHWANLTKPKYFIRWHPSTGERFVFIFPDQTNPADVAITYFPQPPRLDQNNDSLDNPADWLEFVTLTAAIKCVSKIDRDATSLLFQKREAAKRIKKSMRDLDLTQPHKIRQPRSRRRLPGFWY